MIEVRREPCHPGAKNRCRYRRSLGQHFEPEPGFRIATMLSLRRVPEERFGITHLLH